MRHVIEIATGDIAPAASVVLQALGLPPSVTPSARVEALLHTSLALFAALAAPVAILSEVSLEAFGRIYRGEGHNEPETPLELVFPRAEQIALFAVTVGTPLSARITDLFDRQDFALASMLDAAASEATERAADVVEQAFSKTLEARGMVRASTGVLRYSPGYCGWDLTGQRSLFATLQPEAIGITLRDSCLMQPLKSISGVIVAGRREIHEFDDFYPFCAECQTHSCRARIPRVLEGHQRPV